VRARVCASRARVRDICASSARVWYAPRDKGGGGGPGGRAAGEGQGTGWGGGVRRRGRAGEHSRGLRPVSLGSWEICSFLGKLA